MRAPPRMLAAALAAFVIGCDDGAGSNPDPLHPPGAECADPNDPACVGPERCPDPNDPRCKPPEPPEPPEDVASRTTEAVDRAHVEAESRALNATLEQRVAFQTQERNRLWALSRAPFLITDR